MKKYKLKKDFPGSKIGAVWVKVENGFMSPEGRESIKMHEYLFKPFNDWFEDYKEPEEYWLIDWSSSEGIDKFKEFSDDVDIFNKSIGNYFETKEEAEKALEKLKAWKRLKDKGFRFDGWTIDDVLKISIRTNLEGGNIYSESEKEIRTNLNLLFGGEE